MGWKKIGGGYKKRCSNHRLVYQGGNPHVKYYHCYNCGRSYVKRV